ncbi:hypothetical protein NYE70_21325 [Paenibacillus sp. FSL R5-0407]|uniref:hypothetical protein n=1 Tax=Paenibacillus sp. FSL R5-0407 TaxID=2975320 RepID=UPI0030F56FBC
MRNIAIGILVVILVSVLLQPLGEFMSITKEKISIGTALTNAARAAKDRSLEYQFQRDLDATVNEKRFAQYFAGAFEDALNLTWTNKDENSYFLEFKSNDDKYNDFSISLEFEEEEDWETEQKVTTVKMKAETEYKFKSKYLQLAEKAGEDVATKLTSERTLILSIKN